MKGKAWLVVLACLLPGIGVVSAAHAQSSPREDMKDACRDLTRELGSFDPGILDCLESANGKSDVAQCLRGRETRWDYGLDQCVAKRRLVQLGNSGVASRPAPSGGDARHAADLRDACAAQMSAGIALMQAQGKSRAEAQALVNKDAEGIAGIDRASAANDLWGLENGKFSHVPLEIQNMGRCWLTRRIAQLDGKVKLGASGRSGFATQPTTARTTASGKKKEKRIGCLKIVPNPTGAYGAQALLNSCGDRVDFSFCYLSQEEASWNSWGCKRNTQGHYGRGSDSVEPGKTQVLPESTRNTRVAFAACEKGALPFIVGLDFGNGRTVIECR